MTKFSARQRNCSVMKFYARTMRNLEKSSVTAVSLPCTKEKDNAAAKVNYIWKLVFCSIFISLS